MSKEQNCTLIAEIAMEIQFLVAENGNISRASQRYIILEVANKMIKSGLISEDTEDIDEVIAKNSHDFLEPYLSKKAA